MEYQQAASVHVFVSYAHADRKWLDRLVVHLKPLRELCRLEQWDDTRLRLGSKWREEIKTAVERASVAILLVSADFLASDFIRTDELPPLLKAAEENGARILPIIVSPCLFSRVQHLSQFQAVNDPAAPLVNVSYGEQEAVLVRVADEILGIGQSIAAARPQSGLSRIVQVYENFIDPQTFTQLIRIGDWIFDESGSRIVGSGMNAFLVSREEYGEEPFKATAVVSFSNFSLPSKKTFGMNAGLIFGWRDEKQRPRYYNVILSGTEIRLERNGFEPPPARAWEHLTSPQPFCVESGRPVKLVLSVDAERIVVTADDVRVIDHPRPTGVAGRVGLRPWRSQSECTEFVVRRNTAN